MPDEIPRGFGYEARVSTFLNDTQRDEQYAQSGVRLWPGTMCFSEGRLLIYRNGQWAAMDDEF